VVAAVAAAKKLPQLSLSDALELTMLIARKDSGRYSRIAALGGARCGRTSPATKLLYCSKMVGTWGGGTVGVDTGNRSIRPARFRVRVGGLASVAKHPLVLLAAGAIVSGLLAPALTRGAQNHQKGLEIKSDLVRSMSAAASPFLAATLANVLAYNGNVPRSYDLAYEQWLARSNEVQAQLQTYFRDLPDVAGSYFGASWGSFSLRMRDLYYFFRLSRGMGRHSGARAEYARRLQLFVEERGKRDCPGYFAPASIST
jgi:hypothetical protein